MIKHFKGCVGSRRLLKISSAMTILQTSACHTKEELKVSGLGKEVKRETYRDQGCGWSGSSGVFLYGWAISGHWDNS